MASVAEIPYSLLDRRYENDLPFYERHEIGVLAYQPFKGGMLTDRQSSGHTGPEETTSSKIAGWPVENAESVRPLLQELSHLAVEQHLSLSELAIAWVASQPAVSAVVLGSRSAEQLSSGLRAAELKLPTALHEQLDHMCPPPPRPQSRFER
jgi:aryl-alcohol dehydrogenase-like predicted oxidoreductase